MRRKVVLILSLIFITHLLSAEKTAGEILEPYLPMVEHLNAPRKYSDGDDLVDLLNALQIYIASCGKYSKEQYEENTGKELDYEPGNYFDSYYLDDSQMDQSFEGVCHNYATNMVAFINANLDIFYKAGLGFERPDPELFPRLKYPRVWYVSSDPETPGVVERKSKDPVEWDGRRYSFGGYYSTRNVTPHKDSKGNPASNHAWVWVQHSDSVCYWFDPTWTDNTGKLRWGYVDFEKKEEVQLDGYVSRWKFDSEAKKIRNAQYAELKAAEEKTAAKEEKKKEWLAKSGGFNPDLVFSLGYAFSTFDFDDLSTIRFLPSDGLGLSFAVESPAKKVSPLWIGSLDYYRTWGDGGVRNSFMVGGDIGYSADRYLGIYAGGGLGISFGEFNQIAGTLDFVWKVNGGFRLCWSRSRYNVRFDLSYGTIMGTALTCYLGWRF